jgi:hypothetical protein
MRRRPGTTRMRWWGDRSASGSASSHRCRTSHLVRPPVAPHEDNRVVIVPSDVRESFILLCFIFN